MNFFKTAAIVAAMLAPVSASALEVEIDEFFGGFSMGWDRPAGAMILVRYRPIVVEGELYVCGAYSNRGGATITRLGREVMSDATAKISGTTVLRDLRFFNVVSSAGNSEYLEGYTANCVGTGRATTNEELATFEVTTRSGRYRVR